MIKLSFVFRKPLKIWLIIIVFHFKWYSCFDSERQPIECNVVESPGKIVNKICIAILVNNHHPVDPYFLNFIDKYKVVPLSWPCSFEDLSTNDVTQLPWSRPLRHNLWKTFKRSMFKKGGKGQSLLIINSGLNV